MQCPLPREDVLSSGYHRNQHPNYTRHTETSSGKLNTGNNNKPAFLEPMVGKRDGRRKETNFSSMTRDSVGATDRSDRCEGSLGRGSALYLGGGADPESFKILQMVFKEQGPGNVYSIPGAPQPWVKDPCLGGKGDLALALTSINCHHRTDFKARMPSVMPTALPSAPRPQRSSRDLYLNECLC